MVSSSGFRVWVEDLDFEVWSSGFEILLALEGHRSQVLFFGGGSGFRVQGSGFRIRDLDFRVQGSGFKVKGSGFRIWGSGCRIQGLGFKIWSLAFGVQGSGFCLAQEIIAPTVQGLWAGLWGSSSVQGKE